MNKLIPIIAAIITFIIFPFIYYSVMVGIANLIQFLINQTFQTNYSYNVWYLGGLVYIAVILLSFIFRNKSTNN